MEPPIIKGHTISKKNWAAIQRLEDFEKNKTKVMSFWEHREKYPELYVTEEETDKFNYDNRKGKTMTNDTLSTKMAEALAIADAERRTEEAKRAVDATETDKETTFIQTDEDVGHRATVQV
jgi:hypothetical protein